MSILSRDDGAVGAHTGTVDGIAAELAAAGAAATAPTTIILPPTASPAMIAAIAAINAHGVARGAVTTQTAASITEIGAALATQTGAYVATEAANTAAQALQA